MGSGTPWRPRPGIVPLRPLTLGEMYDGAFQAIRANPRTMLGVSAVVMVVVALIGLFPQFYLLLQLADFEQLTAEAEESGEFGIELFAPLFSGLGGLMVTTVIKALATTALTALLVLAVSEAVLGRRLAPRALWSRVRPRLWRVIGLALLTLVLAGAVLVALSVALGGLIAAAAGLGGDTAGVVAVLVVIVGFPLVIAGFVFVWVRISLAGPALVLEDLRPVAALKRSWHLAKGSWWRLFGIQILTGIVVTIGSGIVSAPFSQVGTMLMDRGAGSTGMTFAAAALSAVGEIITGTVFTPFSAAVTSLLYIDRRMRAEGLDVELVRAAGDPGRDGQEG
jgi:hypothetical protein